MINLQEIATYISNALNSGSNPINQYQFNVETQGFHLDKISDRQTGKNFIPVFISTIGGSNNPVANLKQAEYSIPITFYYPVRFKQDFFILYDYLVDVFVGKILNFGSSIDVKNARCNISIPQFGEIQDLDLKEFKKWVDSTYKAEIEVMEPYLSMTVTLFLTTYGKEFIFGDKVQITNLTVYYDGNKILEDTSPIIIERAVVGSSETAPQQAFDETYIKGYPANLGFTKELPLIVKNNSGYRLLLNYIENVKDMQKIKVEITEMIPFTPPLLNTHSHYVTNYSRRTAYGQILGISLTLADLRS